MLVRTIFSRLKAQCFQKKVIILLGARQVGKTTLLKQLQKEIDKPSIWLNADEADVLQELTEANTSSRLLKLIGKNELVIIDEAQQIPEIGKKLKLLYDAHPEIQVIATGSSAFNLKNHTNEPLTGRKREFFLHPLSYAELVNHTSFLEEKRLLENRLIYGSYPEVITSKGNEQEALLEIANSYLYKDVLQFDGIRKSSVLEKLLQALALQVGNEVNYHELSKTIGNIDTATVEKYLDLLEKAYVIFKVPAFSRNLRNEIKKGKKYYFYDNGIRNVLINNFNTLSFRMDKGALWENYLMVERKKFLRDNRISCNTYFWRTHDQAEIDYIEEREGKLFAYEFKWKNEKASFPKSFLTAYPEHELEIITQENYDEFLM